MFFIIAMGGKKNDKNINNINTEETRTRETHSRLENKVD